jgi:uncharacterized phage protein gp47/JayE
MANYSYINKTGVIVPDTGSILTDVQNEYKAAFGDDISIDPSTPQGVLINAEALARSNVVNNNAALANQLNPNIAGGVFLAAILALTGAEKNPALHTTVSVLLTGVSGTFVDAGSQVRDTVNNAIFESLTSVFLSGGLGGSVVPFRAILPGPLVIAPGTVTEIVTAILGWETASNEAAGTPGTLEQSDASARALRKVTLASQGSSLPEAIVSAVYAVEGVTSLAFKENYTGSNVVIDAVTLLPHSIYLCVNGGSDGDVAAAILSKKSGGCNYNGSTSVDVYEPFSMQTYPVKFDRPTAVPFLVKATVSVNTSSVDPQVAVADAILQYAAGEISGETGLIVGNSVSCFELAGAVTALYPGIFIHNMQTATNLVSPVYNSDEIPIAINQIATVDAGSITVVIV